MSQGFRFGVYLGNWVGGTFGTIVFYHHHRWALFIFVPAMVLGACFLFADAVAGGSSPDKGRS